MGGEIRKYFLDGISNACKKRSIVLFVNAVDEAGESSAKEIFRDLQQLLGSLNDHSCRLRVCLSCRHYPEIIIESGKVIVMENFNHEDMARVVGMRIDRLHIFDDSEKQKLKANVLQKSGRVFQWTSLVVDSIIHERVQGNPFQAALETIERVPMGLNLLYGALFTAGEQQCSSRERKQRRALFQWVLFAHRPLSPKELRHALTLSQDTKHSLIQDYKNSSGFILPEDCETRIKTLSRGLILLRGSVNSG